MTDPRPYSERFERVLVYGLGISGRAAVELLRSQDVDVVAVDERPESELDLDGVPSEIALRLGSDVPATLDRIDFSGGVGGIDAIVLSPGVPLDRPLVADARRRGIPVRAEVELAFPHVRGPVVGITGSNGKSTTTALTGALLEAAGRSVAVCGNIGLPVSRAVLDDPDRVFVIELSSFQLETVHDFRPRAAAWLNLAPDHLDRYEDVDAYAEAKARIFRRQTPNDVAVVGADDPRTAAAVTRARKRYFSSRGRVEDGCWLQGDRVWEASPRRDPELLFERSDVPLAGEHNLENAMAAGLLARALGADVGAVRRGLAGFTGLSHRMERVAEIDGVAYYDDSKGTNPAATLRSLEGFPDGSVHLILGGLAKGADFTALTGAVGRKAAHVYLIGKAAGEIEAALDGVVPVEPCDTLDRAVRAAAAAARPGQTVLLSPACASFDQFRSFAHRGEEFVRLVGGLG